MEFPLRNTHDLRITHQKAIKDVTSHDLLFHIFPNGLKDGARGYDGVCDATQGHSGFISVAVRTRKLI